jgi:DNA invertase Pin-like site-specific DNA recombinase
VTKAVAYLRKSRVTSDRHVSWEVQEQSILELAGRHGDAGLLVLSDWNRSGRGEKTKYRKGYQDLLGMIEAGEVSTVYAYSLSRLARSLSEYTRLAELCRDKGVRIRLAKEGEFEYGSATGRLIVGILALFAQMEAELAQERAKDTISFRRQRGDRLGRAPYGSLPGEDIDKVIEAYRQGGSYSAAAKILNERGVPARLGRGWRGTSIRLILQVQAPDILPPGKTRGAKGSPPFLLARLLRCHCGRTLTASYSHPDKQHPKGQVRYRCQFASGDGAHIGPKSVTEKSIIDWIVAEVGLLTPPDTELALAEDTETKRNALLERKKRLGRAFVDGGLEEAEYSVAMTEVDAELARLDSEGRVVRLEPIDWSQSPRELNLFLRTIWDHVQLDEHLRPVFAAWSLPEWRRAA